MHLCSNLCFSNANRVIRHFVLAWSVRSVASTNSSCDPARLDSLSAASKYSSVALKWLSYWASALTQFIGRDIDGVNISVKPLLKVGSDSL